MKIILAAVFTVFCAVTAMAGFGEAESIVTQMRKLRPVQMSTEKVQGGVVKVAGCNPRAHTFTTDILWDGLKDSDGYYRSFKTARECLIAVSSLTPCYRYWYWDSSTCYGGFKLH